MKDTQPALGKFSDGTVPPVRHSHRWHRVYYLLAALGVLIVLLALFLNHQIVRIYNHSVVVNQEWVKRLDSYSELGKLAGAVNAPGNNVFDTHDVTGESRKTDAALQKFNAQMAAVEALRKFEYLIAIFVLMLVGAATIYGHKIKNQMESDEQAKDASFAEVQKEKVNRRFRLLAEAIPQILWTANPDGFVDYYNQKWFDYTGTTLDESEGWGWQAVLHQDDLAHCLAVWRNSIATGESYEIEYRFKRAGDGVYRWHLGLQRWNPAVPPAAPVEDVLEGEGVHQ